MLELVLFVCLRFAVNDVTHTVFRRHSCLPIFRRAMAESRLRDGHLYTDDVYLWRGTTGTAVSCIASRDCVYDSAFWTVDRFGHLTRFATVVFPSAAYVSVRIQCVGVRGIFAVCSMLLAAHVRGVHCCKRISTKTVDHCLQDVFLSTN